MRIISGINRGRNLIDLGKIIKNKLEEKELSKKINLNTIDMILIENQISPIANRMAIIQGMITQYYLMKNKNIIKFISGINKLKFFIGTKKTTYNERKKLSIQITNKLINETNNTWSEFFFNNKKQDDLADCFLQGIWFLYDEKIIDIQPLSYNI